MFKVIGLLSIILFFILLPPAVLAVASQDSIPGDILYPVKRGLENGVLALASLHPASKAWFSLGYTGRRFNEATKLITKGKTLQAKSSLDDLVAQTSQAAVEIQAIKNQDQKEKLLVELNKSINDYKEGLTKAKQPIQTTNVNPTNPPSSALSQPQPSSSTFNPTPSATPLVNNPPPPSSSLSSIDQDIDETIKELDRIEKELEKEEERLDGVMRGSNKGRSEDSEKDLRKNRGKSENEDRRETQKRSNGED